MFGRNPFFSPWPCSGQDSTNTLRTAVCLLALLMSIHASGVFAQTVVEGRLDAIWGDPHPQSDMPAVRILTLTEADGHITELKVSEELLAATGGFFAWNGRQVRVTLGEAAQHSPGAPSRAGTRQVAAMTLLGDPGQPDSGDAVDISGSHPWVSILCKFANVSAEPENLAYFQGMYANQPGGLDDYWREVSYGQINIVGSTAVDWVVLPHNQTHYIPSPGGGSNADLNALFDDCTDAADPFIDFSGGDGGFSGINMMFNADLDCCAWGGGRFASLDGVSKVWRVTWEPPWGYTNSGVIAHEMGHGFGLPHANNWDNDGNPYDSPWDVMSSASSVYSMLDPTYGRLGQHINMYHKYALNWISPGGYLEVNDGEQITATVDASAIQGSPNYYMARLPIPGSNHFYTVEVRKRIGNYDGSLPGNAVIIHEVEPSRQEPSWSYDADVPPAGYADNEGTMFRTGETFTGEDGTIVITVDSETANGFVITIDRNPSVPALNFTGDFE